MITQKFQVGLTRPLQLAGVFVLVSLAFLYMFPDDSTFYELYVNSLFFGSVLAAGLLVMSNKYVQGVGAAIMVIFSSKILSETIFSFLEAQEFGTNYGGWKTLFSISILVAGLLSVLFMVQHCEQSVPQKHTIAVVALSAFYVVVSFVNSGPGIALSDSFAGWSLKGGISILIAMSVVLFALFFSDMTTSLVMPIYYASTTLLYQFVLLPYLFRDSGEGLFSSLGRYQEAANFGKPNQFIVIQVLAGLALLGYCLYLSDHLQNKKFSQAAISSDHKPD